MPFYFAKHLDFSGMGRHVAIINSHFSTSPYHLSLDFRFLKNKSDVVDGLMQNNNGKKRDDLILQNVNTSELEIGYSSMQSMDRVSSEMLDFVCSKKFAPANKHYCKI